MNLLKMNLMLLTALVSLSSCAYNIKKVTPHFIDTVNGVCRKYVVESVDPKVVFKYDSTLPIEQCNGFIAVPVDQAQDMKRHYEEWVRRNKKEN